MSWVTGFFLAMSWTPLHCHWHTLHEIYLLTSHLSYRNGLLKMKCCMLQQLIIMQLILSRVSQQHVYYLILLSLLNSFQLILSNCAHACNLTADPIFIILYICYIILYSTWTYSKRFHYLQVWKMPTWAICDALHMFWIWVCRKECPMFPLYLAMCEKLSITSGDVQLVPKF